MSRTLVTVAAIAMTALTLLSGCPEGERKLADTAQYHYKLASNFFYDKNPQSAIDELYKAIEIDERHAEAHHLLGFIYFGRKDYLRALKHMQMAVTIDPDLDAAVANLGNLYLATEQWTEAVPYFERLLNKPLYRTPYLAHNNLGWALLNLGRLEEAKRYLELAIFYNPKFCLAYNNLGRLQAQVGETREALDRFHKAAELCPNYAEPHYFLGRIYDALRSTDTAYSHFKRCHDLAPETPYGRRCGDRL
jgi:tetratricopeptide (TPR) repeat protein